MDRLIHTPEGVRDVYNQECTKKLYLENQIEQVFHAFGYQDIETPTFEFFDVFGTGLEKIVGDGSGLESIAGTIDEIGRAIKEMVSLPDVGKTFENLKAGVSSFTQSAGIGNIFAHSR